MLSMNRCQLILNILSNTVSKLEFLFQVSLMNANQQAFVPWRWLSGSFLKLFQLLSDNDESCCF